MQFKKTTLATTIVMGLALVGCGGDSNSGGDPGNPENPPAITQGAFIDAAVEGLYYESEPSGKSGFTDADGLFDFEEGDLVTFFLGGEDGLRIGKVSAREVVSPFEATGNYQKALNLARILQSADTTTSDAIALPESLKAPDANMIKALNNVLLHDMGSADDLQEALDVEWVTEEVALEHLNKSLDGLERGSKEVLTDWSKGSNQVLREVSSSLSAKRQDGVLFIHADKLLEEELFNATLGMKTMTYQLGEPALTILAGSNDSTISGDRAASYLACIDVEGIDAGFDGSQVPALCNDQPVTNTKFKLDRAFEYSILSPVETQEEDEDASWDDVIDFGGLWTCLAAGTCSENSLTKFEIVEFDDSDEQDGSNIKRDTLSGSYDSVTGIYTQVKSDETLIGEYAGRQSESISFTYLVDSADSERYVDFIGTWHAAATRDGCDGVAVSTYVFDEQGLTVSGNEFSGECDIEEISEDMTYADLAAMDYWWFTTNESGDSKATLTQLNSTVRWCDADEVVEECHPYDEKINRWEYVPAGVNWDQGTLNRRTLNSDGDVRSTVSMYKK
ncbi:hypothetical protein AB4152_10145 [Vibrio breoganii]|uniref:hypothetical protein n=2 Tax=Vibrio breoganii TaxID=553239 RepID=UPI000C856983|nr:hypothetical protein [Vibrio breoganii]PML30142.1 hypothetical protein BCT82_04520 [Vibrio breoganii]PMO60199.1 hypothetical protein BCT06_13055 [Vibrio breoganii]PMP02298.1 hypothetical protein BCS95_11760 [Vibrio breoganii]